MRFFSQIRRELADNFCHYQPQYDTLEGCAKAHILKIYFHSIFTLQKSLYADFSEGCVKWARDSLELHAADKRDYVYSLKKVLSLTKMIVSDKIMIESLS